MKSYFENELSTRNHGGEKVLVDSLVYWSHMAHYICVPAGFPTDLASFQIGNLALRGKTEEPAVIHDFLYALGAFSRLDCDRIFLEALAAKRVPRWKRLLYFTAVRLFAGRAWKAHRRGTTPGAKFVQKFKS